MGHLKHSRDNQLLWNIELKYIFTRNSILDRKKITLLCILFERRSSESFQKHPFTNLLFAIWIFESLKHLSQWVYKNICMNNSRIRARVSMCMMRLYLIAIWVIFVESKRQWQVSLLSMTSCMNEEQQQENSSSNEHLFAARFWHMELAIDIFFGIANPFQECNDISI